MTTKRFSTQQLVLMAMLIAVNVVLSRFLSIAAWNIKIGFAFAPVVLAAIYLGPLQAAMVAALGDFIGAILFPIGAYFPGFTLTAFLTGLTYGLLLHKRQSLGLVCAAVALTELVGSLLLNTLWISVLYGAAFLPLLATRSLQVLVMTAVEVPVIQCMASIGLRVRRI